jgi:hypothetical protein
MPGQCGDGQFLSLSPPAEDDVGGRSAVSFYLAIARLGELRLRNTAFRK